MSPFVSKVHRGFHWTPARKAELLRAIEAGETTEDDARAKYALSGEELEEWRRAERAGGSGFKVRDQGRRNRDRAARFQERMAS